MKIDVLKNGKHVGTIEFPSRELSDEAVSTEVRRYFGDGAVWERS